MISGSLPLNFTGQHDRGDSAVFVDARFDDRKLLCAKLDLGGSADNQAIVSHAYRRWGTDCPQHLIGDFVFVIYDPANKRIFCARDHIGARPLYYSLNSDHFAFASSIAKTLELDPALGALDSEFAVTALSEGRFASLQRTFIQNLEKLPPGHSLTIEGGTKKLHAYWKPREVAPLKLADDEEYIEAARELLDLAVSDRIANSNCPAAHLSGGLDSSAVAAAAANILREDNRPAPHCYAWHYENPDDPQDDETKWVEAARAALNLELSAPQLAVNDAVQLLRTDWCHGPNISNLLGENGILGLANTAGVDTILSGWGGDESLSFRGLGYRAQLLSTLRLRELAALSNAPGPLALLGGIRAGVSERYASILSGKSSSASPYLAPDLAGFYRPKSRAMTSCRSTHDAMANLIEDGGLTARLEDWALAAMPHGITYSYPLLDRRIMEFALSLPGDLFVRPDAKRWIMRQVIDPKLPDLVRHNRSKAEPVRVKKLKHTLYLAFGQCADLLEDCDDLGDRGEYIDTAKLIRDLRGPEEIAMKNFSSIRRALQFLRF